MPENPEFPPAENINPPEQTEAIDPTAELLQEAADMRAVVEALSARTDDPIKKQRFENMQVAMEAVAFPIHELHTLDHDDQVDLVDKVVDAVWDQDEAAQETLAEIQEAREKRDEDKIKSLTAIQHNRFVLLRRDIAETLGVDITDTALEDDIYRAKLLERVAGLKDASEIEIMRRLGFLVEDQKGNERFNFPEEIFPPHIIAKWKRYEPVIKEHEEEKKKFDKGINDNSDKIVQLDALRHYAHDNLAKAVHDFLDLDDENWDYDRIRKFIAKLVEQRFPTIETRESELTSEAVISRLRAIQELGKIVPYHHD